MRRRPVSTACTLHNLSYRTLWVEAEIEAPKRQSIPQNTLASPAHTP